MKPASEKVLFPNAEGLELAARLELPGSPVRATAVFAHCFTCSKDIAAASRVSRALTAKGFAVLRFDFTGLGGSEGDFANTNFSSNVADLLAAVDYLRRHHTAPSLLIGHSLGGAAVLSAAPDVPEARAVVTIGAPSEPQHVRHLLVGQLDAIEREGSAPIQIGGQQFTIKKEFLEDLDEQRLSERIGSLGKALLILHSPQDEIVDVDQARRIYAAAQHPKSFLSLDGMDHLLSKREDSTYVAEVIAVWAQRYLPATEPAPGPVPHEGQVVVREREPGFAQEIRAGQHILAADEPLSMGGTDTGPTPYDLLLAGLGACTSMTLRMYARHKDLPLEGVSVSLSHDKIHARDCDECETREGRVDRIQRRIELTGPLTEAQRQRMLEIADRCPVHRTLEGEITIRSELAEASS